MTMWMMMKDEAEGRWGGRAGDDAGDTGDDDEGHVDLSIIFLFLLGDILRSKQIKIKLKAAEFVNPTWR